VDSDTSVAALQRLSDDDVASPERTLFALCMGPTRGIPASATVLG